MLERALEIQEAAYRPDHYEVATTLVNIGIVLQSQGDLKAARSTFERALSIFQRSLRPAHDSIVMVSDLLSSLT
jgi:Tfp pilus assembly protein PilF